MGWDGMGWDGMGWFDTGGYCFYWGWKQDWRKEELLSRIGFNHTHIYIHKVITTLSYISHKTHSKDLKQTDKQINNDGATQH